MQDLIAGRVMPVLPLASAMPGPVTTRDPGVIVAPECPLPGPADVATGCPHTPAGALAQLVAIDQAALQSGTIAGVRRVITAWALPGGPSTTSWSGVHAMAHLVGGTPTRPTGVTGAPVGRPAPGSTTGGGAAGGGTAGSVPGMTSVPVVLTPVMGLIKGQDGADFVVPCVNFELAVPLGLARTARVGVSDCQRMVWSGGRWRIGPGPEPAQAPNVWPDSAAAVDVGFADLSFTGPSSDNAESTDSVQGAGQP